MKGCMSFLLLCILLTLVHHSTSDFNLTSVDENTSVANF